jgi:hypothetical protein
LRPLNDRPERPEEKGIATGNAVPFTESVLFSTPNLRGAYINSNGEPEFVVPVKWIATKPIDQALSGTGLFANQHSACKLRDAYTLERCYEHFAIAP